MEKKENQKLFIFPKWEEKIKYLFIFIICSLMRKLIPRIIECFKFAKLGENNKNKQYKFNSYFNLMTNFISDFSVGIFILINKLVEYFKNNNTYKIAPPSAIKSKMKKNFFYLITLIAIIDFIAQFCMFIHAYLDPLNKLLKEGKDKTIIREEDLYFVVLIDIISRYIFSKIILKGHFYKHHILAIVITCLGFIPFIIINIINLCKSYHDIDDNKIQLNFKLYLLLYIGMTIIYSLEDVLNKVCLQKLIIIPLELMFYKAVFQIFFVASLTLYMIFKEKLFSYINSTITGQLILGRLIYRFSFVICNIFRTWSLITIIQLSDPNHLSILKSSEFAILFLAFPIFKFCKDNSDKDYNYEWDFPNLISGIICFIISFIGSGIHNEIIIINRYGFYECTNYYKTEIKKNDDMDFIEKDDKNSVNIDSLQEDSSSQLTESFY